MHEHVEVVAGAARVLADQAGLVGLIDGQLHVGRLVVELAAYVNVGSASAHRSAGDQTALDELVRIVTHDLAVLARARLALIGIYDQVLGPAVRRLVHEAPLETAGKAGAAAATQARDLHLVDDPVGALEQDLFGLVPIALHLHVFTIQMASSESASVISVSCCS